jgi:hypothetical protein
MKCYFVLFTTVNEIRKAGMNVKFHVSWNHISGGVSVSKAVHFYRVWIV